MPHGCARRRRAAPRNTLLIKPNQRGTLTETRAASRRRARPAGAASSRRARARPRTSRSCISRSAGACRPAQGRLVRALRAHGEVERGAAHRGGAGGEREARPAVRALTYARCLRTARCRAPEARMTCSGATWRGAMRQAQRGPTGADHAVRIVKAGELYLEHAADTRHDAGGGDQLRQGGRPEALGRHGERAAQRQDRRASSRPSREHHLRGARPRADALGRAPRVRRRGRSGRSSRAAVRAAPGDQRPHRSSRWMRAGAQRPGGGGGQPRHRARPPPEEVRWIDPNHPEG